MTLKEIIQNWVIYFNNKDVKNLMELYDLDAESYQINNPIVKGKESITKKFVEEFDTLEMVCVIDKIYEDGEWAILEWKDPLGLRGCTFFHIVDQKIKLQRGYWDQLSFLKIHDLPIPN